MLSTRAAPGRQLPRLGVSRQNLPKKHDFLISCDRDFKAYSTQALVGSMVIDAKLGRDDRGSIHHNCNRKGLKPIEAKTDH
ncbi:hypothetical protein L195_g030207 [Trifolium pratense]|uniref:Uncharacterized protein n=1 Tax=Trifolium pratense TaxID=57577 RepID=A0A2K3L6X7_TRIPR|nr:hypothetical protein L195_g030207 [Trifolium pratense]